MLIKLNSEEVAELMNYEDGPLGEATCKSMLSRQQAERQAVIASPLADAWRKATDGRARAVTKARTLRRAVNGERLAKIERWRKAAEGLRAGCHR